MTLELKLNSTPCKIASVNNRAEKIGDDGSIVGQDVDLSLQASIDFLDTFADLVAPAPSLDLWRAFLYAADGLPRSLGIKPIRMEFNVPDHRVTFSYRNDDGSTERLKFVESNIKKIAFLPEGVFCLRVTLQVQIHPQSKDQIGMLVGMLTRDNVRIKIEPPRQRDAFSNADNDNGNGDDAGDSDDEASSE